MQPLRLSEMLKDMDTHHREKIQALQPKQPRRGTDSALDFFLSGEFLDSAAAGTGNMLQNIGATVEQINRPDGMSPTEWHDDPRNKAFGGAIQDYGKEMYDRNVRQYDDSNLAYYLNSMAMSTPETIGTLIASAGAGALLGGPVGAIGNAGRTALGMLPGAANWAWRLAKAYQAANAGGKILRTLTPASSTAFTASEIGAILEANSEKQSAIREYIEDAKRNGTYVPNQTELEAEEKGNRVFRDNVGVISLFNVPQYNLIYGKTAKGLFGKLGRFGAAAGSEGAEEVSQETANAYEMYDRLHEWRNVRDAAVTGAGMGAIFHGAGRLVNRFANRGKHWSNAMGGVKNPDKIRNGDTDNLGVIGKSKYKRLFDKMSLKVGNSLCQIRFITKN